MVFKNFVIFCNILQNFDDKIIMKIRSEEINQQTNKGNFQNYR